MPARSSIPYGRMSIPTRPARPRDPNELAKLIADIATGEQVDRLVTEDGRDLAAVMMGRLGGLKGGRARAATLSPERRKEIAEKAAKARWGKKNDDDN
jgi:hypothetical protein